MCGYRSQRRERYLSGSWPEPDDSGPADPAGDDGPATEAQREAVLAELRRHATADRISVKEFMRRTDMAFAAAGRADLYAALDGLPPAETPRATWSRRGSPMSFPLLPLAALAAAILILGHGWFLFPLAWFLFFAVRPWGRRHHRNRPPVTRF